MDASAPPRPDLPDLHELVLPGDWQAVDLISDLHLCAALPRTFEAWRTHLMQTDADAVFILGDLFEAWVGDDMLDLPFERHCAEVILEATARRQIGFMPGNRDFLAGDRLREACGWVRLTDPTVLDAWGRRILLTHGDALCVEDHAYQAFRALSRGPAWQEAFLALPLVERMRRVRQVRAQTQSRRVSQSFDAALWADVDPQAADRWLRQAGAKEMVHGHTHRPGSHPMAQRRMRHVLTDWDLDTAEPGRAEIMRLTREGLQRRPLVCPQ